MAYAQLSTLGWEHIASEFGQLSSIVYLQNKPLKTLEDMRARGLNALLTSSCGRLFDAIAALLGVCRDGISNEGQAAIELEALANNDPIAYRLAVADGDG